MKQSCYLWRWRLGRKFSRIVMPYIPPSKGAIPSRGIAACSLEIGCNFEIIPIHTWMLAMATQAERTEL